MSTTVEPRDVNRAFAEERAAQMSRAASARARINDRVAAGTLTPLGNNRYRVTDPGSFDNGEILTFTAGMLQPEHGLDLTTGAAALYTTTPAWHALGTVLPGGTSDIEEVLQAGRIAFQVHRHPVLYQPILGGGPRVMPDRFVTVREDTGAALGVVGSGYQVLQNREVFEFLVDLVGTGEVTWESAGALRDGRKVFVSMRLPQNVRIDAGGIDDEIVPFLAAINSHDGSSPCQVVATPWRISCANTERFAVRDAVTRWGVRHTSGARDRIAEARRTLRLSVDYYTAFAAEQETLARTEVTLREVRDLLDDLWPVPEPGATDRRQHTWQQRRDTLLALWQANADRLGTTAYAAERTVTEFLDWHTTLRPTGSLRGRMLAARATAVLEGTTDTTKARAHQHLMTLTRR